MKCTFENNLSLTKSIFESEFLEDEIIREIILSGSTASSVS